MAAPEDTDDALLSLVTQYIVAEAEYQRIADFAADVEDFVVAEPDFDARAAADGPTWVEDLAQTLGLGPLLPSLAGGTDYAWGSATAGAAVPGTDVVVPGGPPQPPPDIGQQVGRFSLTHGGVAPPTALYTVRIGGGDIFQAITDILGGGLTVTDAIADLAAAARDTAGAVHTLASEGAKTFIVPLQPDAGKTPALNVNATTAALGRQLTLSYNSYVFADIGALIPSDGISVHFLDLFAGLDAEVNDPAAFGFTDVADACYVGPLTGGGTVCPNPNSFLYWDQEHGTEAAQQRTAALALNAIPEPGMLAGFVAAGLLLIRGRGGK